MYTESRIPYYSVHLLVFAASSAVLLWLYIDIFLVSTSLLSGALFFSSVVIINSSLLATAIFSATRSKFKFFLIDSILALAVSVASFLFDSVIAFVALFFLRYLGTASLFLNYFIPRLAKVGLSGLLRKRNRASRSWTFGISSSISVIKDGGLALLSGALLSGQTLIDLRVLNITISTLGLIFSPINKILVRYSQYRDINEKYFKRALYFSGALYLIPWLFFGEHLLNLLFNSAYTFNPIILIFALTMYVLFWPTAQLLQFKIYKSSDARFQLIATISWLSLSMPLFFLLLSNGINHYILAFGTIQAFNAILSIFYEKRIHQKN